MCVCLRHTNHVVVGMFRWKCWVTASIHRVNTRLLVVDLEHKSPQGDSFLLLLHTWLEEVWEVKAWGQKGEKETSSRRCKILFNRLTPEVYSFHFFFLHMWVHVSLYADPHMRTGRQEERRRYACTSLFIEEGMSRVHHPIIRLFSCFHVTKFLFDSFTHSLIIKDYFWPWSFSLWP